MQVTLIALTNYFGDYSYSDSPNPTEALEEAPAVFGDLEEMMC